MTKREYNSLVDYAVDLGGGAGIYPGGRDRRESFIRPLTTKEYRRNKEMAQAAAVLKKGEGRMLKAGGPWIFDNEIASLEGSYEKRRYPGGKGL